METAEILKKVQNLPVGERALLVDSLLRTLNPPESKIDKKWIGVAQKRLADLRSGQVKGVPGDEVFAKIQRRFS